MALVPKTTRAMVFRARCEQKQVFLRRDILGEGAKKARPTRARVILPIGAKQLEAASRAHIRPVSMFAAERACAGPFGCFLSKDSKRERLKPLPPLCIGYVAPKRLPETRFVGGGGRCLRTSSASHGGDRGSEEQERSSGEHVVTYGPGAPLVSGGAGWEDGGEAGVD